MIAPPRHARSVQFGPFELDLMTCCLTRQGRQERLAVQPARLLVLLVQRRGELVTREELRSELWPGDTFGDFDHGLNNAVNRLREALGDSAALPRYIQTAPRRGYRFIAEVSVEGTLSTKNQVPENESEPLPVQITGANAFTGASRRTFLWAAAAFASIGSVAWFGGRRRRLPPAMSVAVPLVDGAMAADVGQLLGAPVIAPDGSEIVVSLSTSDGAYLFRRPLKSNHMIRMEGTQSASLPFWSPDSHHIGFFADGQLRRTPAFGGSSVTLCDVVEPRGGCWNGDNDPFRTEPARDLPNRRNGWDRSSCDGVRRGRRRELPSVSRVPA